MIVLKKKIKKKEFFFFFKNKANSFMYNCTFKTMQHELSFY